MEIKHGKILNADCFLIDADLMWKTTSDKFKEDNYYFVDKI
jgi:hypothetical protein